MIDDYYRYEPATSVQDVAPVLQTPPRSLEEERPIGPAPRTPPPSPLVEEPRYFRRQHRTPERFIHENYP